MVTNKPPISEKVSRMTAQGKRVAAEFYRWALRDAHREFSGGFPFLSRLKSCVAIDFLEFVDRLPAGDRQALEVCLVKRFHEEGAFLAGDKLSRDEGELIERYLKRNIESDELLGPVRVPSRSEERKWASGGKRYLVDRKKLRTALKEALPLTKFGRAETFGKTDAEWWHVLPVGKWVVQTSVDTGGRRFQLSYSQSVKQSPNTRLMEHQSILGWLGISGKTGWDLLTDADVPQAAELLAELSSHFIEAMIELEKAL
jgi:hypothetical protein